MKKPIPTLLLAIASLSAIAFTLIAQGPPPMRKPTAIETQPLRLAPATDELDANSLHAFGRSGPDRVVLANGIAEHKVGTFPNRGNPHTIQSPPPPPR